MTTELTPTPRKRSRSQADDETSEPRHAASAKRPRSGARRSNSSTPKAHDPAALPVSGSGKKDHRAATDASANGRREKKRPVNLPREFPQPEDEEQRDDKSTAEREQQSSRSVSSSTLKNTTSVYDFHDSGDELSAPLAEQPRPSRKPEHIPRNGAPMQDGSAKRKRGRPRKDAAQGPPTASPKEKGPGSQPAKPQPGRRHFRVGRGGLGSDPEDSAPESPNHVGSVKSARPPLKGGNGNIQDHIAEPPKLKGILTPRKKLGEERRRKNVAFESNRGRGPAEVYFEDLPSKPVKPLPGSARKPTPAKPVEGNKGVGKARRDGDLGDGEDDEVCVVCSKPNSTPPNEIVFCDGCDMAVHQECYGIPTIPEDEWLCRSCSQEDVASSLDTGRGNRRLSVDGSEDRAPQIANFEQHLRSMQRVLLDRCTGRRRMKLRGQHEAHDKTFQLIEQTIVAGEGNSMLVIGARGSGKTTLVESILSAMSREHRGQFHVVRLNGFIHTDDKIALKEIWRQLGKEMEVEDDLVNRTNNYADTLASLLALLSHPSEIAETGDGITSKSVIFIIDEFDLFATHVRQTLLYNLFDIAQAKKAPIAVLGLSTRIDVVESLEKRVKSRFSHRYVHLSLPKSPPAFWEICRQGLVVDEDELDVDGILSSGSEGSAQFLEWWNERIEALHKEPSFQDHLEYHFYATKSVPSFLAACILPLTSLTPASPSPRAHFLNGHLPSLEPPDSKLHLLPSLSDLDLSLLIAAARLDIVAHTDTVNFAMAYDEYAALMGRQRVQSAGSPGLLALGAAARTWGRGLARVAWERLAALGLLVPAGLAGRAGAAATGLESRMWKVDVALEEIPGGVKLNAVLARWCKEI